MTPFVIQMLIVFFCVTTVYYVVKEMRIHRKRK